MDREEEFREKKKVVIIGGVTAGPKAAARLRRLDEDLDITIVEKSELLSYSGCGLPFYISGKVQSPKMLMATADNTVRDVHFFEAIKKIKILNKTVATAIDRRKHRIGLKDLATGKASFLPYDVLILATGAESFVPEIKGIEQEGIYSLHNIEDAEKIKKQFTEHNAQDVCIIGGGLIGIETAESLMAAGARVTILEKKSYILSSLLDQDFSVKLQSELTRKGIKIITGIDIKEIVAEDEQLTIETDGRRCHTDLIILSAGVRPNAGLAKLAGLEIGKAGGIKINEYLQTSDKKIYAIGDCAESFNSITKDHAYWPLGSVSTKMGRIAADNICGRETVFDGFICTALFKVFDINVARTGLTTQAAEEAGFDTDSTIILGLDKAHYMGDASYISLKIIAERKTRRILGAQGFGKGEVISRISLLACAVSRQMSLEEFVQLDLGYAPAFNNPIDIAQTACHVLSNKMDGLINLISLKEFKKQKEKMNIIDVSPLSEYGHAAITGSISIPLESIRSEEIPFDQSSKIVLYSRTSSGAYEAYRFLITRGYRNVFVLEGGYRYWEI